MNGKRAIVPDPEMRIKANRTLLYRFPLSVHQNCFNWLIKCVKKAKKSLLFPNYIFCGCARPEHEVAGAVGVEGEIGDRRRRDGPRLRRTGGGPPPPDKPWDRAFAFFRFPSTKG